MFGFWNDACDVLGVDSDDSGTKLSEEVRDDRQEFLLLETLKATLPLLGERRQRPARRR